MQKSTRFFAFGIIIVFFAHLLVLSAQDPLMDVDKPSTLDKYDLVARGKMSQGRGLRPVQIARLDNNGEILFACVEGKTLEQLKSTGIVCQQSQLELLVDWNLLEYDRKNRTYKTTIHVYGTDKAASIRKKVGTKVIQLTATLDADLASIKNFLERIDREKNLFAILYGYVLHSYTMHQLGEEIYQKPQLSVEHPFWKGYAWAIYPRKKFPTGVTFLPVEGNQFFFVSAATMPKLDLRQVMAFVKDVAIDNKVDDPELKKSLSVFNLCNEEGKLTIPIIEKEWSTKLENMAKKVYAKTIELAESEKMKDLLGMETQAQAAMFLHYEIRYAFLNYLLEQGMIEAPVDFKNADNNSPTDGRNLVFLIKTEKSD
ncbi:MAG: hypothetical protein JSV17_12460 [Candidatus Aminicenantes bacterium]|nr:MAG: hypothetical protein JSV17_12460 [Candidatus Aminicenantes bacterium]